MLASIDLRHRDRTQAISDVAKAAKGEEPGLPIDLAFSLSQWGWEIALVETTLAQAGLHPAELVALRTADGTPAWLWGSTCDYDTLVRTLSASWGIDIRRTATGALGTRRGPDGFAFDVVFLPAERLAFVPSGQGQTFLADLAKPVLPTGAPASPPSPGQIMMTLEPTAIRVVIQGRALLRPGATPGAPIQTLRATGNELELSDVR